MLWNCRERDSRRAKGQERVFADDAVVELPRFDGQSGYAACAAMLLS